MTVISSHIAQFIVSLVMFALAALTSPVTALAGPEKQSLSNKVMGDPIGWKNTKEKEVLFLKALDEHRELIQKICRLHCNHRTKQADLFQEIVYQLWKAYPSFQNKSKISSWMYSVGMKTALLNYRRKRPTVEFREELPEVPVAVDDSSTIVNHELFHQLSPVNKGIVALMMEGYTRKEIAGMVRISEDAVTMRMTRLQRKTNK